VVVLDPDLRSLAGGRDLPHVYDHWPTRLCLYLPGTGEWTPHKLLVATIVPWSALWCFYFEDWLLTGEWNGGGEHPKPLGRRNTKGANHNPTVDHALAVSSQATGVQNRGESFPRVDAPRGTSSKELPNG
jgi:hypothetical protein